MPDRLGGDPAPPSAGPAEPTEPGAARGERLAPATRRLLTTRAARSIGQGVLVVDFALYLNALGWSAAAIGAVLSASSLFGAALSLMIGPISDRWGRKPFLLVYEGLVALSGLVAVFTAHPWLLAAAAVVGGFGRGANGAAGPFGPAEQAWLAEAITPRQRGTIYSLNNAIGFFGMGLGAVFAGLVPLWQGALPGATAYRPLFAWVLAANAFNFFLLRRTPGGERPEPKAVAETAPGAEAKSARATAPAPATAPVHETVTPAGTAPSGPALDRRTENRALIKLTISNAVNGFAIGLFGPLTSYWFAAKFGVGPEAIGPVFALTFFVTGVASLWAGHMSRRVGIVRSVILIRYVGVTLLVALPLVPWYWAAAALYVLRSALNRGTAGPRQALTMGLVRDERRGTAASIGGASFQLPGAAGPTLGGLMLEHGALALPWLIGAGLQLAYAWMYGFFFREYEVKDEPRGRAAGAAR